MQTFYFIILVVLTGFNLYELNNIEIERIGLKQNIEKLECERDIFLKRQYKFAQQMDIMWHSYHDFNKSLY